MMENMDVLKCVTVDKCLKCIQGCYVSKEALESFVSLLVTGEALENVRVANVYLRRAAMKSQRTSDQ